MASSSHYKILAYVAAATGILALILFAAETTTTGTALSFLHRGGSVQESRQLRSALDPKTVDQKLSFPSIYALEEFDPADLSPPSDLPPFPADACRPHIVLSTMKCPECDALRHVIEDNVKYTFSVMGPDRLAFFVPSKIRFNEFGVPILSSIYETAMESCPDARTYTYINGDILTQDDFLKTVEAVSNIMEKKDFLIVGGRRNVKWSTDKSVRSGGVDFDKEFTSSRLFNIYSEDYFVVTKGAIQWSEIPPFVVGRVPFDNWLVNHVYDKPDVALIDATSTIPIIHQTDSDGQWAHGGSKVKSKADSKYNHQFTSIANLHHRAITNAEFETRWEDGKVILYSRLDKQQVKLLEK